MDSLASWFGDAKIRVNVFFTAIHCWVSGDVLKLSLISLKEKCVNLIIQPVRRGVCFDIVAS